MFLYNVLLTLMRVENKLNQCTVGLPLYFNLLCIWLSSLSKGLSCPGKFQNFQEIFDNQNPVIVEIGFGMGYSLIEMAQNQPNVNFVGIEVHRPGIAQILLDILRHKITNLKIVPYDVLSSLN